MNGDGEVDRNDYLIFARDLAGVDENYIPNLFVIDDLIAYADVDCDDSVTTADYLLAYATLYEKGIDECLTNGISQKTSMLAADINGDGDCSYMCFYMLFTSEVARIRRRHLRLHIRH